MYKQCSIAFAFMSKQRGAQRRSSERSERYKQCSNAFAFMSKRYKRYKRYIFLSKGVYLSSNGRSERYTF